MDYTVVGLSHHTAPLELRERLAVPASRLREGLRHFDGRDREGMVVSTCNRVEVLVHGLGETAPLTAGELLSELSGVPRQEFAGALRVFRGDAAVRHAFRVASGLDSMVLGEPQILGQWKDAWQLGSDTGTVGAYLGRLGQRTLQVARRIRSDTDLGRHAVNMAALAVDLAEQIFEHLGEKHVLVLGAGEMAELAVAHFHGKGMASLRIANRTRARAEELAARYPGSQVVDWEAWAPAFATADVVLVGAGGAGRLFETAEVRQAARHGHGQPRVIVDLAVPRAVDPGVGRLNDHFLYCVDDLEALSRENLERRRSAAEQAERMIDEAVLRFHDWYGDQRLSPLMGDLARWLEEMRRREAERTMGAAGGRTAEALVAAATSALTRRIQQALARQLKAGGDAARAADMLRAVIGGDVAMPGEDGSGESEHAVDDRFA